MMLGGVVWMVSGLQCVVVVLGCRGWIVLARCEGEEGVVVCGKREGLTCIVEIVVIRR